MADDVEHAALEMVEQFGVETEQRMPSDALTQFLAKRAELKRHLAVYETGCWTGDRFGTPDTSPIHMRAIRHQIAEYERAITILIPRRQPACTC
jgi:hypothetical protein